MEVDTPTNTQTSGEGSPSSTEPQLITPEWVLANHRQQQEVNAQMLASLQAIQSVMATMKQRHEPTTPAKAVVEPMAASGHDRKAKHSLSHPDKYDGQSKTAYPSFRGQLRAKLRIDALAIGGEEEQVWYGFGRLSGSASERIFPWIEATQTQGMLLRVATFFEQMDAAFYDAQIPQRALEWINTKKQGSTPFREFLQDFEQKLLEAGGWEFSDGIRKGYLKAALNLELRTQLVARDEPESYASFVNLVRKAADDLEQIRRIKRSRTVWDTLGQAKKDQMDAMDWEPTPRTASGKAPNRGRANDNRPKAKWVSKDTIERRRCNRECLRCGDDGHFIDRCSYAPPKFPEPVGGRKGLQKKVARTGELDTPATFKNSTKNRPKAKEVTDADLDSASEESENE